MLHVLGVGQDGCCGDTEMLSGSSGVNSCGVLAKITSHVFLSDLERDYGNDRDCVAVAFKESI